MSGVALTWECVLHFPLLPSFCFYLKHAGKLQWVLKALWAVDLDFNFVGQEGAHQWLRAPKQSYHVYQLLGSLLTSGAERGRKSVTFPLFVPKILGRIKSSGSICLSSSHLYLCLCFPSRRPPAPQAVLCYVLICMRMHLATFYVCRVVQRTLQPCSCSFSDTHQF